MSAKQELARGPEGAMTAESAAAQDEYEARLEHLSHAELLAVARRQREELATLRGSLDAAQPIRSEEALRLSRFAIENAAESMFTVAEDGQILDVNKTTCRRLGYTANELRRMTPPDFDLELPKDGWPKLWRELRRKGSMTIESIHQSKRGQQIPVEITTSHFEFEGAEYACTFVRDITQRKRAEKHLRLTRFAVDCAQEAMFTVSPEGRILDVNRTACERLGYSHEELLERRTDAFDLRYRPEIWPEHYRQLKERGSMTISSVHRSRSGRVFPVEINEVHFEFEGEAYCCSFVSDVSERKQAERAQRLSRFAVDTATEAMFTIDASGAIVDVNPTACERLEYSRDEMIGRSALSFDERSSEEDWAGIFERIKRRGKLVVESEHRTRSGRVFPVEASIAYFELEGEEYLCSFVRDITERKHIEQEQATFRETLKEKNRTLQIQNDELEAKNAEMERFTYTVSHDLKSPLVTIKGFLGLLERDVAAGDVAQLQHDLERISAAADRMYRLLDELLELSRVGRVANPPELVALSSLVDEALEHLTSQLATRRVEVVVAPDLPDVWCDRVRLVEVLQNLVENAIKFMGSQSAPRLEIGARQQDGETLCHVADNGIGIDPRYTEKIFGLFERLDQSINGTGVGLTLVRRIVEVHGGRTWVESAGEGRGATFFFSLPLRQPSPLA